MKILRDWLDAHADNPYPTEDEKIELEKQTELKPSQIANWLANARRRRKATERAKPKLHMSPSLRPSSAPMDIPRLPEKPWDELNPLERWKHSPPENEPATMSDIANAVANSESLEEDVSASPSTLGRSSKRRKGSSNGSGFSNRRAPSTTSQETGQTSSLSASSAAFSSSNVSSQSTHGSFSSFSSSLAGKKDRRRRRRPTAAVGRKQSDDRKRIFQCTFCTDTFKSKYDWTRHEKSLHLSLEKWICAPSGPTVTDQESGNKQCVYCGLHNPSSDHLETHNHRQCEDKGLDARTFYRKDHLRQHLRLMHSCEMTTSMDSWKSIAMNINSRCGFCAQRFTVWQERVDHLTAHFKAGSRMADWKGCRGLDPAVAAQVTNAMPPYLIGMESVSPNPFSATNRATWRLGDISNNGDAHDHGQFLAGALALNEGVGCDRTATCWEILTVRLGKYAREMSEKGIVMTDEMLQNHARLVLYDSEDAWNQTAADHPEWLDLFKKAHGLNFIPSAVGGRGSEIPEDLETYGDLGLRIPFAVQLQAYNAAQSRAQANDAATRPGPYQQARDTLRKMHMLLSEAGVLVTEDQSCKHIICSDNLIDITKLEETSSQEPQIWRWCHQSLLPRVTEELNNINCVGGNSKTATAAENRAKAMQTLWDLEDRDHQHNGSCSAKYEKKEPCGNTRADPDVLTARSRARGLNVLAGMEAAQAVSCPAPATKTASYLKRHKYELPVAQARLFETTTRAWGDSGSMPQAVHTSLLNIPEATTTSTGAMMEFLGGDVGASLPFSNDALTSQIELPDFSIGENDWELPGGGAMTEAEMMDVVDATTFNQADLLPDVTAMDFDWNAAMATTAADFGTLPATDGNEFAFDDLTFDGVFDVPFDETFGPVDTDGRD